MFAKGRLADSAKFDAAVDAAAGGFSDGKAYAKRDAVIVLLQALDIFERFDAFGLSPLTGGSLPETYRDSY